MADATPFLFDGARELTDEELALIAGGGIHWGTIFTDIGHGVTTVVKTLGVTGIGGETAGRAIAALAPDATAESIELAGAQSGLSAMLTAGFGLLLL